MTTVLLAEDHQLLRHAVRDALAAAGLEVVGEAADGEEAIRLAREHEPDVVLMDVTMPVLDGIEATRRICAEAPGTRVTILTMHGEQRLLAEALRAGAVAFLSKDCSMQEVVDSVLTVAAGEVALSAELGASMLGELSRPDVRGGPATSPLTTREEEVLQLVADGRSTAEVADELYISTKTVKNHLASIYEKLDTRDRTQAVLTGVRLGIVQLQ